MKLGVEKQLLVAGARTAIQLTLVGLVLKLIFENEAWWWTALLAFIMLMAAGREVMARQKRPLAGWWGFGVGVSSMMVSSFTVTFLGLYAMIGVEPWHSPQYAIPLLGMLLGNTMTGVALGVDRLLQTALQQKDVIEQRLLLGQDRFEALADVTRESIRSGMIPILNGMAAAGLVSLPGMMTGQILAGSPPVEAVKYQILIMFLIAVGTGLGVICATRITANRLFDERHRLRLDRLGPERR